MWDILSCPYCHARLVEHSSGAQCVECAEQYPRAPTGVLDLRLRRPKPYTPRWTINMPLLPPGGFSFVPLRRHSSPHLDLDGLTLPRRLSRELASYIPAPRQPGALMIDVGCGGTIHRPVFERAGFAYVGIDYQDPNAPLLADAQALPFSDESFECAFSISVLQQIPYPSAMIEEVYRVLKPGALFLGTVAFLEPFAHSFYHCTHLGTYNLLRSAGFEVSHLAPATDRWTVLRAVIGNGLFPKMPRWIAETIIFPVQVLHRAWWWAGGFLNPKARYVTRLLQTTGAYQFVASKPGG